MLRTYLCNRNRNLQTSKAPLESQAYVNKLTATKIQLRKGNRIRKNVQGFATYISVERVYAVRQSL